MRHSSSKLYYVFLVLIISALSFGCGGNSSDQAESGDSGSDSDSSNTASSDSSNHLFNIIEDQDTNNVTIVSILCEPDIADFSVDDIQAYAQHVVDTHEDAHHIRISFYNANETPGVDTPDYKYQWTRDGGLKLLE